MHSIVSQDFRECDAFVRATLSTCLSAENNVCKMFLLMRETRFRKYKDLEFYKYKDLE